MAHILEFFTERVSCVLMEIVARPLSYLHGVLTYWTTNSFEREHNNTYDRLLLLVGETSRYLFRYTCNATQEGVKFNRS